MGTYHLISHLEGNLRAVMELQPAAEAESWLLQVKLIYDGEPAGEISFNLLHYTEEEARHLAHNITDHGFIMREIDDLLFGDSE
ncbi:MAG: hypothetical protein IBX50_02620 [Marinospirillum sp.]|uniref:hypothetical protein n=1 Tax=Marinospirillum sp. TaxID=2183934 RepID=UPI001A0C755D|nr:hypothetical protein [Marinospirillum sp.]MBE0505596.1 hypothetical protein [Marinospirillum sp.]